MAEELLVSVFDFGTDDNFGFSFLISIAGEGGGTFGITMSSSCPTSSLVLEDAPSSLKNRNADYSKKSVFV